MHSDSLKRLFDEFDPKKVLINGDSICTTEEVRQRRPGLRAKRQTTQLIPLATVIGLTQSEGGTITAHSYPFVWITKDDHRPVIIVKGKYVFATTKEIIQRFDDEKLVQLEHRLRGELDQVFDEQLKVIDHYCGVPA